MTQSSKQVPKPRDPQPAATLFFPSPAASHVSLPGPSGPPPSSSFTSPTSKAPLVNSSNPLRATTTTTTTNTNINTNNQNNSTAAAGGLNINLAPLIPPIQLRRESSTRATDRTDALWAEMQATLEAVEQLSAGAGADGGGGGAATRARIFGPEHERKLDELRAAQIALAQAWARSEADEAIETTNVASGGGGGGGGGGGEGSAASEGVGVGKSLGTAIAAGRSGGGGGDGGVAATDGANTARSAKSTVGTGPGGGAARPGSSAGQEKLGDKLEQETEVDILLARKRREANDRYFQRVNQGVLDVVAKLEDVAVAMRAVERESKELWADDNESLPGSAKT